MRDRLGKLWLQLGYAFGLDAELRAELEKEILAAYKNGYECGYQTSIADKDVAQRGVSWGKA